MSDVKTDQSVPGCTKNSSPKLPNAALTTNADVFNRVCVCAFGALQCARMRCRSARHRFARALCILFPSARVVTRGLVGEISARVFHIVARPRAARVAASCRMCLHRDMKPAPRSSCARVLRNGRTSLQFGEPFCDRGAVPPPSDSRACLARAEPRNHPRMTSTGHGRIRWISLRSIRRRARTLVAAVGVRNLDAAFPFSSLD
jgi:hypothetical protein